MGTNSMYEQLGVDPRKTNVKEIFGKIIDNEFLNAFVNVVSDPRSSNWVMTQHLDGDGSKFIQRVLDFFENSNPEILKGMVDDGLAMNTGDIASAGFVFGTWLVSDVLNVNFSPSMKKKLMKMIATRVFELKKIYEDFGFKIKFLGGETADLPDQVKTGVFDMAVTAFAQKKHLVKGDVKEGDLIFGFQSNGRALWEVAENSGIMSNGLTLARSCLLDKGYNEKYPELKRRNGAFYKGRFKANDKPKELDNFSVSEALLSPTRQWAVVIRLLMENLEKKDKLGLLHGITMNTGGGATKITNIGRGISYYKKMPEPPELFKLINQESGEKWKNMFESFNCGIGIDIVGEASQYFLDALEETAEKTGLKLFELGVCAENKGEGNKVFLDTPYGKWEY